VSGTAGRAATVSTTRTVSTRATGAGAWIVGAAAGAQATTPSKRERAEYLGIGGVRMGVLSE
jgi:hypothetical protein